MSDNNVSERRQGCNRNVVMVFRMLKGNEDFHNTPVVFLTGVAGKEQVERVMELRPRGYILKSNTREKLLEYIQRKI